MRLPYLQSLICCYDALIHVQLGDLSNGSQVAVSMVASRVSLTQKDGQISEIAH